MLSTARPCRQCRSFSSTAFLSSVPVPLPLPPSPTSTVQKQVRKSDWKRRQEGSNFVDTLTVNLFSGKGGSGGVAFHREKFKAKGPPSGGPGGGGGSVYLLASTSVTSLSHLPRTVRGGAGTPGLGKWLGGKRGEDMIIRVPVGTVVREVRWEVEGEVEKEQEERLGMTWAWEASKVRLGEAEKREKRWDGWKRAKDLAAKEGREENDEPFRELEEIDVGKHKQEALERWRKELFVTYPLTDLASHPSFLASEHNLLSKLLSRASAHPGKKTRRRKSPLPSEDNPPLLLDLVQPTPIADPILLLSGGTPGLGNPSFQTTEDRSPKYATRGGEGDTMRLELEVKSGGEVGLVGAPNAGKSHVPSHPSPFHLTLTPYIRTILRALTSSTPRVAAYPFTTLNPHHGTCVLYSDSTFSGPRTSSPISNTSSIPETFSATSSHPNRLERRATLLPAPVRKEEVLRFTITDNPGLVPLSSLNVGLGHAFLRHVERCSALVYVVDLSAVDPVGALESVRKELREYGRMKGLGNEGEERGLEGRVKGVVANKADLFGEYVGREGEEEEDVDGVSRKSREEGERKLGELISYVREMERSEIEEGIRGEEEEEGIWVVPLSAKKRENVGALVKKLESTVRAERRRTIERIEREEQEAREDEEEEARRLE